MNRKNLSVSKTYNAIFKNVKEMPDEKFFNLDSFHKLLRSQMNNLINYKYQNYKFFGNPNDNTTAYTDGNTTVCNTLNSIVMANATRYGKYISNIGICSHECGHNLFTDFYHLNTIREDIRRGNYDFKYQKDLQKRPKVIQNVFVSCFDDMINIVEDGYVERCLLLKYPKEGILAKGIIMNRNYISTSKVSILERIEAIENGEDLLILLFNSCLLISLNGNKYKDYEKASGQIFNTLDKYLKKASPIVKEYVLTGNYKLIEKLACLLYELLPEDPKNQEQNQSQNQKNQSQSKNSQSQSEESAGNSGISNDNVEDSSDEETEEDNNSNNGNEENEESNEENDDNDGDNDEDDDSYDDGEYDEDNEDNDSDGEGENSETSNGHELSEEEIEELLKKVEEELKKINPKFDENNLNSPLLRKPNDEGQNPSYQESELLDQTNSLESQISEQMAEEENVKKEEKLLREILGNSRGIKIESASSYDYDKASYDCIVRDNDNQIKKAIRKIQQILRYRDNEELDDGFLFGSRFDSKSYYRNDGKYFSRNKEPDNIPDVAFSICIDASGSMSGYNMIQARKAGIVIGEIAEKLNIPTKITSHRFDYYSGNVEIETFKTFAPSKLKYSIPSIEADGSNYDVCAIETLSQELLARTEKIKVLIMISDGEPCSARENRGSYNGIPFKDEIRSYENKEANACVRYWRKKGVLIFGVCIDEYDKIREIYENCVIDCTQKEKLPSELEKIFTRYVLK